MSHLYGLRPLEPHVKRYAKPYRRRLRKLARGSRRLADLIVTYPAAAYALVSGRGPVDQRGAAIRMVKDGAPLDAVSAALELPNWSRKLPPEAFEGPLGLTERGIRDAAFAGKITNYLPEEPEAARRWLRSLDRALVVGGEEFAIWLAGQNGLAWLGETLEAVDVLAAFVWHSGAPETRPAKQLQKRWNRRMGLLSAVNQARTWLMRTLNAGCYSAPTGGSHGWTRPSSVGGYRFTPRVTAEDLESEGRAMHNCVGTYWDRVRTGRTLIYGIRRGGKPVATLAIVHCGLAANGARISELEAPGNRPAHARVRDAVDLWLSRQGPCPLRARSTGAIPDGADPRAWRRAWGAYVEAVPAATLFAEPEAGVAGLNRGFQALGRPVPQR